VVYDTYYNVNKIELLVCLTKNCEQKKQFEKKLEILKGRGGGGGNNFEM